MLLLRLLPMQTTAHIPNSWTPRAPFGQPVQMTVHIPDSPIPKAPAPSGPPQMQTTTHTPNSWTPRLCLGRSRERTAVFGGTQGKISDMFVVFCILSGYLLGLYGLLSVKNGLFKQKLGSQPLGRN